MMKLIKIFTACLLLLPAGAALAQKQSAPPQAVDQGLGEIVNVNVVNLDVFVTDKSGKRIQGLKMDDFDVFENGKKMAITNFYAVEGGKAKMIGDEPAPAVSVPKPGPPGLPGQTEPLPEDQRLRLVVYIDNFNLHPFNRNRVMR